MGWPEALVLMLAAAAVGALLVVLPQWRNLMRSRPQLPIHRLLSSPTFEAEVRCAFCISRQQCLRLGEPPEDCPNLELLQKRKPL
jgi:hypothetical protein